MDDTPAALLASQPIYDRDGLVAAAELLFRNDLEQNVTEVGEERATSQLLYNLCTGITDQVAHSGIPVFLNVSADFLLSRAFLPVPPRQVVIELVERIDPTPEVIECVAHWSRQGFRFALDDFEFAASWDPLLAYADIIKVDVLGADPEQVLARKAALSHLPVQWLAERIETREEYELYRAAGFDLFQGYFFARPRTVLGTALPPSTLQLARLLAALHREESSMGELAEAVSADPALAIKLIRIANSPFYRGQEPIDSVQQVLARLGIDYLRRWVTLFGLLETTTREHAVLVLTRARLCELLAREQRLTTADGGDAFLAGLVSGVDLLLGVAPATFMASLNLDPAIRAAVCEERGPLGELLGQIIAVEYALIMRQAPESLDPLLVERYREAHVHACAILSMAAS